MLHYSIFTGAVRIFYTIQSGHLTELTAELEKAQADADFISTNGFIDVLDGENSAPLPLNITDDSVPEVQEVFVVALTGSVFREMIILIYYITASFLCFPTVYYKGDNMLIKQLHSSVII